MVRWDDIKKNERNQARKRVEGKIGEESWGKGEKGKGRKDENRSERSE